MEKQFGSTYVETGLVYLIEERCLQCKSFLIGNYFGSPWKSNEKKENINKNYDRIALFDG